MSKRKLSARDAADKQRLAVIALLTGENVESLGGKELRDLLVQASQKLVTAVSAYDSRDYADVVALALSHLAEAHKDATSGDDEASVSVQLKQALSKAVSALIINPRGAKAKHIKAVAEGLLDARRLIAAREFESARQVMTGVLKHKIALNAEVYHVTEEAIRAGLEQKTAFETHMQLARNAIAPGENQNFATARTEANLARNGWNDADVDQLLELVNTTEAGIAVFNAGELLKTGKLNDAGEQANYALSLIHQYEPALAILTRIANERAVQQFYAQATDRCDEKNFAAAWELLEAARAVIPDHPDLPIWQQTIYFAELKFKAEQQFAEQIANGWQLLMFGVGQTAIGFIVPETGTVGVPITISGMGNMENLLIWTGTPESREEDSRLVGIIEGAFTYTFTPLAAGELHLYVQPTGLDPATDNREAILNITEAVVESTPQDVPPPLKLELTVVAPDLSTPVAGGTMVTLVYQTEPNARVSVRMAVGNPYTFIGDPFEQDADDTGRVAYALTLPEARSDEQTVTFVATVGEGTATVTNTNACATVQARQPEPINPAEPLRIVTTQLTSMRGSRSEQQIEVVGGVAPYTFRRNLSQLNWLILAENGMLTIKTPNKFVSKGSISIIVTDSTGATVTGDITVNVTEPVVE